MTQLLGLSSGTWQTLLLLAFPLIYRYLGKLKLRIQSFLSKNKNQPSNLSKEESDRMRRKFRMMVLRKPQTWILISSLTFLLIQTTYLNPNRLNPFSLTKNNLKVPSTTLQNSLSKYYRSIGIERIPEDQQRLLQRLTSFDARLMFATLGRESLLECAWCRPPSSRQIGQNTDHLLYVLPRLLVSYLFLLVVSGIITTGSTTIKSRRRVWRSRLSIVTMLVYLSESIFLSALTYLPSLMTSLDSGRMIWDGLHVFRRLIFSIILVTAWLSVINEPIIDSDSIPITKLGLGLNHVSNDLETLLNRLRIVALQRSAIMRTPSFRSQTIKFWEDAENQSKLANEDERVRELKDEMGLSLKNRSDRDRLKIWIDAVYPDPTNLSTPT